MTFSAANSRSASPLAGDLAAALDWWREAGLEHDFRDTAADWLAPRAPAVTEAQPIAAQAPPPVIEAPRPEPIGGGSESWPQDLPGFVGWWLAEPSLDFGQVQARVPPRGAQGAELLIVVDHPEAGDSDRLLSGEQGRLAEAILAALGVAPEKAYFAAALVRHTPLPDWPALADAGLGAILAHHIRLAAPRRVISFGPHVSSLLGHDPAKSAEPLRQFYHVGGQIPALAAPGLTTLAARPKGKAALWRALLEWQHG